jgi:hypothetical protein
MGIAWRILLLLVQKDYVNCAFFAFYLSSKLADQRRFELPNSSN